MDVQHPSVSFPPPSCRAPDDTEARPVVASGVVALDRLHFEYDEARYIDFKRICNVLLQSQHIFYQGKMYEVPVERTHVHSWRAFFQHLEKEGTVVLKDGADSVVAPIFQLIV